MVSATGHFRSLLLHYDFFSSIMWAIGDKSKDRALKEIEGATILPGKSYQINSCGSFGTPSGTTGSFELAVSDHLDTLIRRFHWDCPWGSKTNTWKIVGMESVTLALFGGSRLM